MNIFVQSACAVVVAFLWSATNTGVVEDERPAPAPPRAALADSVPASKAGAQIRITSQTTSGADKPAPVNLSDDVVSEWCHWGLVDLSTSSLRNRSRAERHEIGDLKKVGNREVHTYETNPRAYSWSNGAPVAKAENTRSGVFIYGKDAGFELDVAASDRPRTLRLYTGAWRTSAKLLAAFEDGGGTASVDFSQSDPEGDNVVYSIHYRTPNDTKLKLRWTNQTQGGNVTIQAAALLREAHPTGAGATER